MKANRLSLWTLHDERGFTLAEMLTVLAIIVLLSTLSIVATTPFISRSRVRYATRQAHAAILQARHYAIARNSTASVVFYSGERFCVVTNAQYEPIDAPVVLPEGLTFRPSHTVNTLAWARAVGDDAAAKVDGYTKGYRTICIVTFQHDGTVKFVTPRVDSARNDGAIVICIGGGQAGVIMGGCGPDDNVIRVTGSASFASKGLAIVDNEIISYGSVVYQPTGNRTVLQDVARGVYTSRRSHGNNAKVYSGWDAGILVIFPLTGGVVQAI